MNSKVEEMRLKLINELDEARYQHTLGVMYTAASMAMRYGEDIEKALIAGLLHDCAKCIPGDVKVSMCHGHHREAGNDRFLFPLFFSLIKK